MLTLYFNLALITSMYSEIASHNGRSRITTTKKITLSIFIKDSFSKAFRYIGKIYTRGEFRGFVDFAQWHNVIERRPENVLIKFFFPSIPLYVEYNVKIKISNIFKYLIVLRLYKVSTK